MDIRAAIVVIAYAHDHGLMLRLKRSGDAKDVFPLYPASLTDHEALFYFAVKDVESGFFKGYVNVGEIPALDIGLTTEEVDYDVFADMIDEQRSFRITFESPSVILRP